MKYSKEQLQLVVNESKSIAQVMKKLGLKPAGGNHSYMKKRLKRLEVNTDHFLGQASSRGITPTTKREWHEVLVLTNRDRREAVAILRRAMIESGIKCECKLCGLTDEWQGRPLVLEIDHKNGNPLDNRKENVRFLCPNCHAQETKLQNQTRHRRPIGRSRMFQEHDSEGSNPSGATI